MAKVETKEKPEKKEAETFKYGVEDVADGLGIKAASARVQLRNHDIKKAGKSYGWNSKAEVEEVVKKIQNAAKKTEKADKPEKAEKAAKPAAKMEVKKKSAA